MAPDENGRAPLSEFFGIVVTMHNTDSEPHGEPPHFHASYERHVALIAIDTLEFLEGWLPNRAYAVVLEWAAHHRAELRANWDRARQGLRLERVVPLE